MAAHKSASEAAIARFPHKADVSSEQVWAKPHAKALRRVSREVAVQLPQVRWNKLRQPNKAAVHIRRM